MTPDVVHTELSRGHLPIPSAVAGRLQIDSWWVARLTNTFSKKLENLQAAVAQPLQYLFLCLPYFVRFGPKADKRGRGWFVR
jgi:hypothetical protein